MCFFPFHSWEKDAALIETGSHWPLPFELFAVHIVSQSVMERELLDTLKLHSRTFLQIREGGRGGL